MKIKHILKGISVSLLMAAAVSGVSATAQLPVKGINGKEYYVYTVGKKETIYTVAEKLGVQRDKIVRWNPGAADGLRADTKLYFPKDECPELAGFKDVKSEDVNVVKPLHAADADAPATYTVGKSESLYGISHKTGISPDRLLALNPGLENGVKAGMVLRLKEAAGNEAAPAQTPKSGAEKSENKVPEPPETTYNLRPVQPEIVEVSRETLEPEVPNICLILPLGLDKAEGDRTAATFTEFYRGFLLGMEQARHGNMPVRVTVLDAGTNGEHAADLISSPVIPEAAVVILPDQQQALNVLADKATDEGVYSLNFHNLRDSLYMTNPLLVQATVPSDSMNLEAAKAFVELTLEHADEGSAIYPVILRREDGKQDRDEFINIISELYTSAGVNPVTITFDGILNKDDLANIPANVHPVFIPASGTAAEFNKIWATLQNYIEALPLGYGQATVIGYPDWLAFRGDTRAAVHKLRAVIFSRYATDTESEDYQHVQSLYRRWYGTDMQDAIPSQALVGYDAARYILANLKVNGGAYDPATVTPQKGVQNIYNFVKAGDGEEAGFVNDYLYIIRFESDGKLEITGIK